jgi:hypothetical protein
MRATGSVDFNLAYIGSDFSDVHNEEFNTAYMKRLFDYAYQLSVMGDPWHKSPPGVAAPERHTRIAGELDRELATPRLNGFSDWIQSSVRVLAYKESITSATTR